MEVREFAIFSENYGGVRCVSAKDKRKCLSCQAWRLPPDLDFNTSKCPLQKVAFAEFILFLNIQAYLGSSRLASTVEVSISDTNIPLSLR
jgi:hypothetical protein